MKKLLNPIEFFDDKKLLIFNLIVFAIGTVVAILMKATFSSPIDLHFATKIIPLETFFGNLVSVTALFVTFFLSGKIINKKTRFIDCLNLAFYVRIPYYVLTLSNFSYYFSNQLIKIEEENDLNVLVENTLTEMIIGYVFIFCFFAFLLMLGITIYRGFTIITNAKKTSDYLILVGIFLTITILSSFLFRNI